MTGLRFGSRLVVAVMGDARSNAPTEKDQDENQSDVHRAVR